MVRVNVSRFTSRSLPRSLVWIGLLLALLVGVMLGLVVPRADTTLEFGAGSIAEPSDGDPATPRFVASEYHETVTTLWLRSASDPSDPGIRLADIPHAIGWDIEAAVSPRTKSLAVLAVPPNAWNPASHASLLLLDLSRQHLASQEAPARELATGLDLRGGVVWSDDARRLLVRRGGTIDVLDASDGRAVGSWTADSAYHIQALAMRSDVVWLAQLKPGGSSVTQLRLREDGLTLESRIHISDLPTRDWALSPDGSQIAFTEQRGVDLQVRVITLSDTGQRYVSDRWTNIWTDGLFEHSASPLWQSDGSLNIGTWSEASATSARDGRKPGFTLPLSLDPSGQWLASRWLSGNGPGSVTGERLAIQIPTNETVLAPSGITFVGWWPT